MKVSTLLPSISRLSHQALSELNRISVDEPQLTGDDRLSRNKQALEQVLNQPHYTTKAEREVIRTRLDPANDYHFDPSSLLVHRPPDSAPADSAAIAGKIRGPVGGADAWTGRRASLKTSRIIDNNCGSNNFIGCINSRKMAAMLMTESSIEGDMARLLDWCPGVRSFISQPGSIRFRWQGRWRRTYPDFQVERWSPLAMIVEVKTNDVANDPLFQMKAEVIASACAARGKVYGVIPESWIREQPRLNNVNLLRRYKNTAITPTTWAAISDALSVGARTIGDIHATGVSLNSIYAACFRHYLRVDINQPISLHTEVLSCL